MPKLVCLFLLIGLWAATVASAQTTTPQRVTNAADEAALQVLREVAATPDPTTQPAAASLRTLTPGEIGTLRSSGENRGARVTIHTVALLDHYGQVKPTSSGGRLLVLDSEWENIIPLTLIQKQQIPTAYSIPVLGDHAYVVVDKRLAARLRPDAKDLAGHVPAKDFGLPRIGDIVRGNLVFELPVAQPKSLELRFYDYAHGHVVIPLLSTGELAADTPAPEPAGEPATNDVIEAAVSGFEKLDELDGESAPEGMTYLVADLRARSRFTFDADATAFDSKAKPGDRTEIGTVADWTEAYQNVQLVLDGEYAYTPLKARSDLPDQPRFLPDIMTGGRLAFLVSENFTSAELQLDTPNARTPSGMVIKPEGLILPIEGARPPLPTRDPVVSIDDEIFSIKVTKQQAMQTFAGVAAGVGERFLVLDVTVDNNSREAAETFQTKEQLKHVGTGGGQPDAIDETSYKGPRPPSDLLLIPKGERRSFQVVYRIPADEEQPRLAYAGVSKAETVDLPKLAPGGGDAVVVVPEPADAKTVPDGAMAEADSGDETPEPASPPVAVDDDPEAIAPIVVGDREFPGRVNARPPLVPKGIAGAGLTAEQVNASIETGAGALWGVMRKNLDGREVGTVREHCLMLLALVHADAHDKDPEVDATVRQFLSAVDPYATNDTYENAILCMLIDAYGDPTFLPKLRATAQWFVDTQGPEGTWNYRAAEKLEPDPASMASRRPLRVEGGGPPGETAKPLVRLSPPAAGHDGDNSTTQYAVLGLNAAARNGIDAPDKVWALAAAETRARQQIKSEGGWSYTASGSEYGSMTCAGICTTAIADYETGEADPSRAASCERGLAWLNAYFRVDEHPRSHKKSHHYYYLYALERVGRVLDTEFIGEHEWYPLGARWLIDNQQADGLWDNVDGSEPVEHATSFALLFLTRATPPLKMQEREGPGKLITAIETLPGLRVHIILDCSGSMLEEVEGRPKFDIAREAVANLIGALPAGSQVALQVYGHRLRANEQKADEDTEILVPMSAMNEDSRSVLLGRVEGLRARGKTPLTASLNEAARAMGGGGGGGGAPVTVVLLTDGGEDTLPKRDPIAAARALVERPGVTLHVVGFDIDRADWLEQLRQMALAGGGSFVDAEEAGKLGQDLRSVVMGTPDVFTLLDDTGKRVSVGAFGEHRELPPGPYRLVSDFAGGRFEQAFWIHPGGTTSVIFDATIAAKALAQGEIPPTPESAPSGEMASPGIPETAEPAPAVAAKKFCTSCGQPLAANIKFCTSCGAAASP